MNSRRSANVGASRRPVKARTQPGISPYPAPYPAPFPTVTGPVPGFPPGPAAGRRRASCGATRPESGSAAGPGMAGDFRSL
jgi:hypothetical protein